MKAYIITIGDEILIGQVTDTNATYMATALSAEGIDIVEHLSVSDSRAAITSALDRALEAADIVLMTGGLGPTKDDITKSVLADYFDTTLEFHEESWERLQAMIKGFGRAPKESHREQCYLPAKAEVLVNKMGTAPGMLLRKENKLLVSMPGVPYEMRYLVDHEVMPRVQQLFEGRDATKLRSVTILTAGAGESVIAEMIADVEDDLPQNMSLAYLPNLGTVRLRLSARGNNEAVLQEQIQLFQHRIEAILAPFIYGYGTQNLAGAVGALLESHQLTLGTAESCTGGRIAQLLTSNAGSSAYFHGSIVAYDNAVKMGMLNVEETILAQHGAVSETTARAMVKGGLQSLGTDLVVATTGIAGPGGGTPEKPVGTIWIAVGNQDRIYTKLLRAGKDRQRNITYAAFQALNLVRRFVVDPESVK